MLTTLTRENRRPSAVAERIIDSQLWNQPMSTGSPATN